MNDLIGGGLFFYFLPPTASGQEEQSMRAVAAFWPILHTTIIATCCCRHLNSFIHLLLVWATFWLLIFSRFSAIFPTVACKYFGCVISRGSDSSVGCLLTFERFWCWLLIGFRFRWNLINPDDHHHIIKLVGAEGGGCVLRLRAHSMHWHEINFQATAFQPTFPCLRRTSRFSHYQKLKSVWAT